MCFPRQSAGSDAVAAMTHGRRVCTSEPAVSKACRRNMHCTAMPGLRVECPIATGTTTALTEPPALERRPDPHRAGWRCV
jgi:hypothetical protein